MRQIQFFIKLDKIPRTTAQQQRVFYKNGKPVFVKSKAINDNKNLLINELSKYKPDNPFFKNIELTVIWNFETSNRRNHNKWKNTSPDLDNMQKLLQDCMTKCCYWQDDSRIVSLILKKIYNCDNTGILIKVRELEDLVR